MILEAFCMLAFISNLITCQTEEWTELSKSISYFEFLHISFSDFNGTQNSEHEWKFSFSAFGKIFNISVQADQSMFSNKSAIYLEAEEKSYKLGDLNNVKLVEGKIDNVPNSRVNGYISGDSSFPTFTGNLEVDTVVYYIEPASKYSTIKRYQTMSIIYKDSDVKNRPCKQDSDNSSACVSSGKELNDYYVQIEGNETVNVLHSQLKEAISKLQNRRRRATGKVCFVELLSSYTFYNSNGRDILQVAALMAYHLKYASKLFESTDFNRDGRPDNIGLAIDRFTIFNNTDFLSKNLKANSTQTLRFCASRLQFYCLSICFVHHDFETNVIGMSFRADPNPYGAKGGLCQNPLVDRNTIICTNTLVVTSQSGGDRLPLSIVSNSLAHEIAHSFGAPHDSPENELCSPGGKHGNYIMTDKSNKNTKKNHRKFSPCSIREIQKVIETKGYCLKDFIGKFCGNGIIEEDEECDCGTPETCRYIDSCCTPMGGVIGNAECTIRRDLKYVCSPKKNACCSSTCQITPKSLQKWCYLGDKECSSKSICDGTSFECPFSSIKKNGALCQAGSKTCSFGTCNSTICEDNLMNECDCSNVEDECHLCCYDMQTKECKAAHRFKTLNLKGQLYVKESGTFCPVSEGYCNLEGTCIKLSFTKKFLEWFTENQALLIFCSFCILILFLFLAIIHTIFWKPHRVAINPAYVVRNKMTL